MADDPREQQWGYLVTACYKGKKTFPMYTVTDCASGAEAIEHVLTMGFAFSQGCWVLRAIRVALIPPVATPGTLSSTATAAQRT